MLHHTTLVSCLLLCGNDCDSWVGLDSITTSKQMASFHSCPQLYSSQIQICSPRPFITFHNSLSPPFAESVDIPFFCFLKYDINYILETHALVRVVFDRMQAHTESVMPYDSHDGILRECHMVIRML
ncbi:unnamed protein product [Sympodiomycopsis kandeliae]